MKNIFLNGLVLLIAFSQWMNVRALRAEVKTDKTSLVWVGRVSQDKPLQVRGFTTWLKQKGYPEIEIRFDENNAQLSKVIIQGLSGLGGDILDTFGAQLQYLYEIGLVTGFEKGQLEKLSGTLDSDRYAPYTTETDLAQKEYGVPFNISVDGLLVNRDLFIKAELPVPNFTCDQAQFEKMGTEFVKRLNSKQGPQIVYLTTELKPLFLTLMRSAGVSLFNETLTASAVRRSSNLSEVLTTLLKWTYQDHLIPTPAEIDSFTQGNSGYMNAQWQEFTQQHFGLLAGSRYLLMPLRELKCSNDLDAMLPPHWGYPTSLTSTRYLTVYRGTDKKESVALFAAYLRSEAYNQLIIEGGDNLPPIPKFMESECFLNPPKHPNEAKLNQSFKKIALSYATGRETSPYVLYQNITKLLNQCYEVVLSKVATPEQAVDHLDKAINHEIAAYLKQHTEKKVAYEQAQVTQKALDQYLKNGGKVPLKEVPNPFLKKYYQDTGRGI